MSSRFPKRRPNGSFTVDALFDMGAEADIAEVGAWLDAWSAKNAMWVREWKGAGQKIETETLRLSNDFSRPPYCVDSERSGLTIRLEGTKDGKHWRDWFARLVQDLRTSFPTVRLRAVVDVDDE
jgi:hypothetical protein